MELDYFNLCGGGFSTTTPCSTEDWMLKSLDLRDIRGIFLEGENVFADESTLLLWN